MTVQHAHISQEVPFEPTPAQYHSKFEWVAVRAMEKASETCVNLCRIWAEQG